MFRSALCALALAALVAPAEADCKADALKSLRASPDGAAVYARIPDKGFFRGWIACKDVMMGLPTAVHESVHFLTAEADAFPLVGGGEVARPHEVSGFYPPSKIAGEFKTGDYAATYLRPGRASSSGDFLYLLDEMNAYSHDLAAATDLKGLRREGIYADNRDGLAALMAFTAAYVEHAKAQEPATWDGLHEPQVSAALGKLWKHAETSLAGACGIPHFGMDDKTYIRRFCAPGAQEAMADVIGFAPVCPTACLKPEPDETAYMTEEEAPDVAARTLWSRRPHNRKAGE